MRTQYRPIVALVAQRHPADCGVAALAMIVGRSYEDALLAFGPASAGILRRGVWGSQVRQAAAQLGVRLTPKKTWDYEHDEGVAQIRFRRGSHHLLALRRGLFIDTNFEMWEPDEYIAQKRGRLGWLLAVEP